MPYRSARQRAYMHIHLPEIAARWDKEYGGAVSGDYNMSVMKQRKRAALEDLRSGKQKGAAKQRSAVDLERRKRAASRGTQGSGTGRRTVQTGSGSGARVKRHPPGKPYQWDNGTFHTRPQGKQYRSTYRPGGALRNAPKAGPGTTYRYF